MQSVTVLSNANVLGTCGTYMKDVSEHVNVLLKYNHE